MKPFAPSSQGSRPAALPLPAFIVIDQGRGEAELIARLRSLLGGGVEVPTVDMAGCSKESVARLGRMLAR